MAFIVILSIYLFIQSDVNKTRWKRPPVFIYLCKSLVVRHGFRFNIQYLFIYLFKGMSTKAGGSDDLYLLIKLLVVRHRFRFNIQYLFIYLFKAMSTKAGGSDDLFITACNEVRSRLCFYIHN